MQDQLSNQTGSQVVGQTFPQLQRINYSADLGVPRDGNPTYQESSTDMEQHYQPLERLHGVGLHGWGIAAGLQVAFTPHQTGVTVRPGIALDSHGLHILLVAHGQADIGLQSDGPGVIPLVPVSEQGVLVPTDTLTGDQFLVIRFFETVDRANFCTHTPWVHFVTPADLPTDGSSVILARMAFDSGSNKGQVLAVSQNVRQSVHRHIEQAHEFMTQGPAVVTGLSVSATPNSPGITVSPGLALDSAGRYISLSSGGQAEVGLNADAPGAAPMLVNVSDSGVLIPTTGLTGFKMLTIQHWETPTTVTLPIPPITQQTAPFSFRYTPRFQFVDELSQTFDPPSVVLAFVTFGADASGSVTNLTDDDRGSTVLEAGGIFLVKNINSGQSISTGAAGSIGPLPNGLALTVANTSDEIHMLSSDNGQNLAKISLDANKVVARSLDHKETVVINSNTGDITSTSLTTGNVTSSSSTTTNHTAETIFLANSGVVKGSIHAIKTPGSGLALTVPNTSDEIHMSTDLGQNIAKISLAAEKIVARQANGSVESIVIDSEAGNVTGTSLTAKTISITNPTTGTPGGTISRDANSLSLTTPNTSDEIHLNTGNVAISNSLSVTGPFTVSNTLTANGNASVAGTLNIAGNTSVNNGSLNVAGNISTSNHLFAGNTSVNGSISINNSVSANGNVAIGVVTPRTQLHVLGRISTGLDFSSAGAITFFPPDGLAWFHIDNGPAGGRPTGRLRFSFGGNPGDNEVMSIDQGRNVRVTGNFSVSGTKSFVQDHPTDETKQIVYISLEGGEASTYIRGTGTLIDGKAVVDLPEHFRLVTHKEGLTVQLTPRGEWLQLYVVELNTAQVVVREAQGKNGEFDYFVQGIREGYEDHQVIQEKVY
ncbi:hypothetical protein KSF_003990 [Reticulibacter mediterranei]|uniref:Uncharacterized protein n=1 Tax=Reticulibacter mediterranei TaxID=2778369 RepID=A0A8J3IIN2_9CHLR|nr:hypothetical protein [Reticulibacter mediterranei]GHO90351.1 hypothetical protein KSF_003990 [Reticulibacter mediterranei]